MSMEAAYAQVLWDLLGKGMTPREAVDALREQLEQHGRMALMPRIAKAFVRIAERDREKNGVTLYVADAKDERAAKHALKGVLDELGVQASEVSVAIDASLIGGWRLEGKEQLVDGSYKRYLLDMYNRATRV